MNQHGDVKINDKWYRIDLESYRDRDIVDFSPKASTPGGSVVHSELMLYQPQLQSDWKHGFGFVKYSDDGGYMKTTGNVDTRHDGIAMMFTQSSSSDTGDYPKVGGVVHRGVPYFWGKKGVRKYVGGAWATEVPSSGVPNTNLMFSLGTNLFAVPYASRIRTTLYAGQVISRPDEVSGLDSYIYSGAPTANYANNTALKVGTITATGLQHNKMWIKPVLTGLPAGATVASVELTVYCSARTAGAANLTLKAGRVLVAASESMTWNKHDGSTDWTSPGGSTSGTDYSATLLNTGVAMSSQARQFFTMTLDATEFASLVSSNNGILVWEESTDANNLVEFYSSSGINYDQRPYFTIKYTLAADWTDTGVDANAVDYNWEVVHNGFTYLGVRDTNRVHYSSSITLADLEGTTADTGHILVGGSSYSIINAISFLGSLYIAKPDGLWLLGEDKIAKRILDFSAEASDLNFKSMVIHNGFLVFTIRDVVYQWNGNRLNRITPPRFTDSWPYTSYGNFANFVTVGDYMYCTGRTNESTYTESLLSYDGSAWHKLQDIITTGVGTVTMLFYDVENNYLWVHTSSDTTETTSYIPFQDRSSFPYANFPTTGTHSLYFSKMDMGFSRVIKSMPSLLIEAYNVTHARYLTLYYSLDETDEWVEWGRVLEEGITTFTLPGGLHTQEFYRIQIRVDFTTTDATQSPILEGVTLRFLMRPEMALGWNFNVILADHFVYGEIEDERTAHKLMTDLREARDSKKPIDFVDIDGGEYKAYVSAFARSAQERNVDEMEDGVYSIESTLNINIVEAK